MPQVVTLRPKPKFLALDTPRNAFTRRLTRLNADRSEFLDQWRQISDNVSPMRGRFLIEDKRKPRSHANIINSTPTFASRTLASGMHSGMSSPARPWFKLTTPDDGVREIGGVRTWLDTFTKRMQLVFALSNFYNSAHALYGDLGDYGTGVMILDEDYEDVISARVLCPGEYALAVGYTGKVDTLYREFNMSVGRMIEHWGDGVSRAVRQAYDQGNYDQEFALVQVIEPNMRQIPGERGPIGKPFVSVYFEKSAEGDDLLEAGGYHEWPVLAPRWDLRDGDVYGTGPGRVALGDCKGLQHLERRAAQAVDKMVTPPTKMPASMKSAVANHLPGGVTYVDETTAGNAGPLYTVPYQVAAVIDQRIEKHERRIQRAYFEDLFLMLAQSDRREITAREIVERHEEKLLALGPVVERSHHEMLNPGIVRTSGIMTRAQMIDPPPEELDGMELRVEYISIMAQAQRAVVVGGIERLVGFVGNLAAGNPAVLDKVDFDQTVDEYGEAVGVPASIVRSDDAVAKIRADRAQQEQAAQAGAAAAQAAEGAKVLSEAKTGEENLLTQILSGGAGV